MTTTTTIADPIANDRPSSDSMAVAADAACVKANSAAGTEVIRWEFQIDGSRIGTSGKAWHQGCTASTWDDDASVRAPIKTVRFVRLPFGANMPQVGQDCTTAAEIAAWADSYVATDGR